MAYRISCHGSTKTSPYHLVYGQDAVLPWEITAGSRRVEFQNDLSAEQYATLMNDNVEDLTELRLWSLEKIKENKAKVARAYNKKVKPKDFQVGDLVWEAVLPLGLKIKSLVNGLQLGMGRTRLIRFCLGMRTCSTNWTASSFLLLSMVSTSRSTSRACGRVSNKCRCNPSGCNHDRPTR